MFNKLIGNERAKEVLIRLLTKGRLPNALLFAGPDGVGKKRFALEVAKSFVCRNRQGVEACDECPACRRADVFEFPKPDDRASHERVIFSEHPDVGMVIPYNRNILVEATRDIELESQYRPFEAPARFFIIDEADKMNVFASNALLKTLEEPAQTSYIFLVTSRPDALLQTIRSRCQVVRFSPVATDEIVRLLEYTGKYSKSDAELAARTSGGSIGRALAANSEDLEARRRAMLDVLMAAAVSRDRVTLLLRAEEMNDAKNKDAFEDNLDVLRDLIHDAWLLRIDSGAEIVNADIEADIRMISEKANSATLAGWIEEIEELRRTLAVNINRKIAADALFLGMAG